MKALRCLVCGAPLNPKTLQCEYCGTYHERDTSNPQYIYVREKVGVKTLCCKNTISRYLISSIDSSIDIESVVTNRIAHELAEGLKPYIEITSERDLRTGDYIVTGKIRVLDKDYKFEDKEYRRIDSV